MSARMRIDSTDELLALAGNRLRREALRVLRDVEGGSASLEYLAARIDRVTDGPRRDRHDGVDAIEIELHHVHLPKLDDAGVVEYDRRFGRVRYEPHDAIEELLDFLDGLDD